VRGAATGSIGCRSPNISVNAVAIIVYALSFVSGVAALTSKRFSNPLDCRMR